jgi:hypothetical protein
MVPSDNVLHWGGYKFSFKAMQHSVLYVDPPSDREAIAVVLQLWNPETMPPGAPQMPPEERAKEIECRIVLVGRFPGYLVHFKRFSSRCKQIAAKVEELAKDATICVANVMAGSIPSESGKVNVTRVDRIAPEDVYPHKPWGAREECFREVMPLALYYAAKRSEVDLAAASAVAGGSSFGEFFERRIVSLALQLGDKNGFAVYPCSEPSNRTTREKSCVLELGNKQTDMAYAAGRILELDVKRFGNRDEGFKRLRSLKSTDNSVVWLPTEIFPVADFALSSQHVVNAKVAKRPEMSCETLMNYYKRLHGADSDVKVTLDLLLPCRSNDAKGAKFPNFTLKGTKEERKEALDHFDLRVVTIPLDVMGHCFDRTVGASLEKYGFT